MSTESFLVIMADMPTPSYTGPGSIKDWKELVGEHDRDQRNYFIYEYVLERESGNLPNEIRISKRRATRERDGRYKLRPHGSVKLFGYEASHLVEFLQSQGDRK